jgi:ferredoxin-type protein NapF
MSGLVSYYLINPPYKSWVIAMTSINPQRRAFLRGRPTSAPLAPRMPWHVETFFDDCQRCDECVRVCPQGVVRRGDGGYPKVDPMRGGCTFCGACASACRHGALHYGDRRPWQLQAKIGEACLNVQGVTCRSCVEACDYNAIRFRPVVGGRAQPEFDDARCNGCGSCVSICPVNVIQIQERT